MSNFESSLSAVPPESSMDQIAVEPLSGTTANGVVLTGRIGVRGWVSNGDGVAGCSESVEGGRGVGKLDFLVT